MTIAEAAVEGFRLSISYPNIIYAVVGTIIGMFFGILPGVGPITAMALLLSFTFGWKLEPIILLFAAVQGGSSQGGSITAILVNIPGTAPNAATILDGYPMSQNGRAKVAIGASASASALGAIFGIGVLILLIPIMRAIVLVFGPPEFLMLAVLGLTVIAVVSEGNVIKGIAAAGLGLMFAFFGEDPMTGTARFSFGLEYLWDGLKLVPVFLGIFAIGEMIDLAVSGRETISGKHSLQALTGSVWEGIFSIFRHFSLFVRSSIIGTVIGIIPGIGGTVAGFVAYGQAVQTAKDPEKFGTGDIRGVIAPQASNDAKDGGALVPTVTFGIPGSEGMALLLVAMTLHGIVPGKELLTNHLVEVFLLIWALVISNVLSSIFAVMIVNVISYVTVLRTHLLVPAIFILSLIGAYAYQYEMGDVVVAFVFGFLGYYMKKHTYPRISLVIALVLGGLIERSFNQTLQLQRLGQINFFARPVTLLLIVLTIIAFALPYIRSRKGSS
jgi:putative tricarboxylic transport membrane protein